MQCKVWLTNKHENTWKSHQPPTWEPPKLTFFLLCFDLRSWKQWSQDGGVKRLKVLEGTKEICCAERAGTPCLDQKCCQSPRDSPAMSPLSVSANYICLQKISTSRDETLFQMKALKWIWFRSWLGSGWDMGPKFAVSNCKLEYKYSMARSPHWLASPRYGSVTWLPCDSGRSQCCNVG